MKILIALITLAALPLFAQDPTPTPAPTVIAAPLPAPEFVPQKILLTAAEMQAMAPQFIAIFQAHGKIIMAPENAVLTKVNVSAISTGSNAGGFTIIINYTKAP